jgi:hypothetical protein
MLLLGNGGAGKINTIYHILIAMNGTLIQALDVRM